jgi:hypothetical protein
MNYVSIWFTKIIVFSIVLFSIQTTIAQVGVRAAYQNTRYNPWEQILSGSSSSTSYQSGGFSVGLDYWFRLPDHRVEFFPELNYSRQLAIGIEDKSLALNSYGLELNTHFYFMDFFDDCDCPTWSKSNDWFQKGFFLSIAPGAHLYQYPAYQEFDSRNQVVGSFAVGAGLDIGFSDLITVTPFIKWRHFFTPKWEGLTAMLESTSNLPDNPESRYFNQIQAGFRIGLRF